MVGMRAQRKTRVGTWQLSTTQVTADGDMLTQTHIRTTTKKAFCVISFYYLQQPLLPTKNKYRYAFLSLFPSSSSFFITRWCRRIVAFCLARPESTSADLAVLCNCQPFWSRLLFLPQKEIFLLEGRGAGGDLGRFLSALASRSK